jgi:hypothetical protein
LQYTQNDVNQRQTPEEYWASVEEEIGETVKGFVLARLPEAGGSARLGLMAPSPKWGLAFLTETMLYIDRSSTPNWFQRLVQRDRAADDQERTAIPVRAITHIDIPKPKRGLSRILGSPEVEIEIHFQAGAPPLCLMLDRRGPTDAAFISLLAQIAERLDSRGEE